ncbi:hypothetical protein [Noviherbaspirillum sp. Root189]|uniref:hypothetical protein n=1 Tax=Noviherbaspirillum sp. Root189 TaxID=1736487 RepID=UPI00070CF7D5|nr:hypothetical protein [Noviherbaspirillum sp. Root189]KRB94032.1 hypothetical protein ASE07_00330 [Noviherbaspirillum sp. Root189]
MKWELDHQIQQPQQLQQQRSEPVRQDAWPPAQQVPFNMPSGFVTFRYSSTEVFSQNGQVHVKMRETRYQDGRLSSQECEGSLNRDAYQRMVSEAQSQFLNQMFGVARLLLGPFIR